MIDKLFEINDQKIPINKYHLKLMDGVSANTGKNSGIITRMEIENQRNWHAKIPV